MVTEGLTRKRVIEVCDDIQLSFCNSKLTTVNVRASPILKPRIDLKVARVILEVVSSNYVPRTIRPMVSGNMPHRSITLYPPIVVMNYISCPHLLCYRRE
jgi:hypothetical protein